MFRDRELVWYMKYHPTMSSGATRSLDEIKNALIAEFKKPKSESQCITERKEIKQSTNEMVWDFVQRFKSLVDKMTFELLDKQHKEWFIATLMPHIRLPLCQQKLATQAEALEAAIEMMYGALTVALRDTTRTNVLYC